MTNSPKRSSSRNQTLSPQRSSSRSSTVSPKRRLSLPRPTPKKISSEIVAPLKQTEAEYEEEGIVVAVRMRPLNQNEDSHNRVWKVLPKYSSVSQTTREGKPLPERISGRTFFTFDKTFGENSTTKEVYDSVAKEIVNSVVTGLNGTIFAYGQTSSGKTYTMQGSGSIKEGSMGSGGIVHMAAQDIFSAINKAQGRIFLVRASFLEIYNEEVRDLLANNSQTLQIREDPRRGVFVQSKEEIVTDFDTLLGILFQGESNRAFASTAMNERSSRSHTIFRITIESRKKNAKDSPSGSDNEDEDKENQLSQDGDDDDDGAVLISTLNLVDLAGSESVRHTGATGERQKEGGMINTSLLTLSRVIVALGTPNQTHVNFRDSKLTRILQPSLSGNARMAVVCCATPSELYLEETRSTMMFASRAKLVKTRAQVNEVLDDRSIIRKLQRELADARRNGSGSEHNKQLKALEQKADAAGTAAKDAEEKLLRLKRSILNSGVLFSARQQHTGTARVLGLSISQGTSSPLVEKGKRRLSEGALHQAKRKKTPEKVATKISSPHTTYKLGISESSTFLPPSAELDLLKKALVAKNNMVKELNEKVETAKHTLVSRESDFESANRSNEGLLQARDQAEVEAIDLRTKLSSLEESLGARDLELRTKNEEIQAGHSQLKGAKSRNQNLEACLKELRFKNEAQEKELRENRSQLHSLHEEKRVVESTLDKLMGFISSQMSSAENSEIHYPNNGDSQAYLNVILSKIELLLEGKNEAIEELDSKLTEKEFHCNELATQSDDISEKLQTVCNTNELLVTENATLKSKLGTAEDEILTMGNKIAQVSSDFTTCSKEVARLQSTVREQQNKYDVSLHTTEGNQKKLKEFSSTINNLKSVLRGKRSDVSALARNLEDVLSETTHFKSELLLLGSHSEEMEKQNTKMDHMLADIKMQQAFCNEGIQSTLSATEILETQISDVETCLLKSEAHFSSVIETLSAERNEMEVRLAAAEANNDALSSSLRGSEAYVQDLRDQLDVCRAEANCQIATLGTLVHHESYEKAHLRDELFHKNTELQSKENIVRDLELQLEQAAKESKKMHDSKAYLSDIIEKLETKILVLRDLHKKEEEKSKRAAQESNSLVQELKDVCKSRGDLESSVGSLMESQISFESQIEGLKCEKETLEAENVQAAAQIELLNSKTSELEKSLEVNDNSLAEAERQISALREQKETLQSHLLTEQQKLNKARQERDELTDLLTEARSQVGSLQDEVKQLNGRVLEDETNIAAVKYQLGQAQETHKTTQGEKEVLESELESSVIETEKMGQKINELEVSLNFSQVELMKVKQKSESLIAENRELQTKLGSVSKNYNDLLVANESLTQNVQESDSNAALLKADLQRVQNESSGCESRMITVTAVLSNVCKSRDEAMSTIQSLQLQHEVSQATIRELDDTRASLKAETAICKAEVEAAGLQLVTIEKTLDDTVKKLEQQFEKHNDISREKQQLQIKIDLMHKEHSHVLSERDGLANDLAEAELRRDYLLDDLSRAKDANKEGDSYIQALKEELTAIQSARHEAIKAVQALELKHTNTLQLLESQKNEKKGLESQLSERSLQIDNMREQIIELRSIISSTEEMHQRSVAEVEESLAEKTRTAEELNAKIAKFEADSRFTMEKLEAFRSEKRELETKLQEMSQEIADGATISESLKGALKSSESQVLGLQAKILKLETDRDDQTNELLQQARQAAFEADDKVQEKEKELHNVMYRLSKCKDELDEARKTIENGTTMQNVDEDLLEQIEEFKKEHSNAVALLDKEKADREESEKELRKIMGEEQRLLIQEAESSMTALRNEKNQLKKQLTASEAEAYAAREENETFRENVKRAEGKVAILQGEAKALKDEIQGLKQSLQDQEVQNGNEISRLISSVNASKAELYAGKQSIMDLEERLRTAMSSEEYAARDVNNLKDQIVELKSRIEAFVEENGNLKDELQNAKANIENYSGVGDAEELRQKIRKLEEESTSKDARIKRLEAVRLTKDQCTALKKMKKENVENKQKLAKAENELAKLRALQGSHCSGSSGPPSSLERELAELQFDKEALEKKLRKYASHCQLLEDDKASIMDALRSCCDEFRLDDDVTRAVVSLCDKHASLQEKFDSVRDMESRISTYESELEKCRIRNVELESQLEVFRGASNDNNNHQVRYLEQENLQLMVDLKNVKKQLQSARSEINVLRMKGLADSPAPSRAEKTGNSFAENALDSRMKTKEKSPARSPFSSKENSKMNGTKMEVHSGAKKRPVELLESTPKRPRRLRLPGSRKKSTTAPGLGEPGKVDPNAENASECKQS